MTAAAWHPDPTGRHELRYWDGSQWTEHVSDGGVQSTSPLTPPEEPAADTAAAQSTETPAAEEPATDRPEGQMDESPADDAFMMETRVVGSPPPTEQPASAPAEEAPAAEAPPSEAPMAQAPLAEAPPAATPAPAADPYAGQSYAAAPAAAPAAQPGYSAMPGISGDLVDGRFSEKETGVGPSLQNGRLLRVRVAEPFMARQGSMVAYQGQVGFAYQGGGAGKFLKKALTGEGLSLMRVEGAGDVFLANGAEHVHILHLNNSGISINGNHVLAFSGNLDWNVERVKGGSIAAGGLFNTTLRGSGWVAITTDGEPVVLNAGEAPTFADTDAVVAWSVDLQTSIVKSFTAGALIGRGSGEAFQVAFGGQGFVIVQPSEGGTVPPHTH
ncbi:AIM24 family protein [Nocardioides bizhenqiangii]|uniref:AIM24 family protein n=1 Tax=Nocardioides bizhenqiangii TaxID=3095076 RepID=A0ABZ0ZUQ1_9ACTN|nr:MULTISPECIES: AIM24 family protein [unclassified Nocardioides]MDZ5621680.1 AIM24 family protein [Nocardioides sp. HM23]WQQ27634.1 AIM24 family protein [Nocardioides sp. HM61]